MRPAGKKVPPVFEVLNLGKPWSYGMNANELNWYTLLYGCVVKFGPEGGEVRGGVGGVPVEYGYLEGRGGGETKEIKGAKWIYYGASPLPSWRLKYPDTCLCESPRFDVDEYGRCFFTDAGRFRCGVLDSAGNEVCFFGAYGNADSAGPGSRVPVPEIPLLWPYVVEVRGHTIYVGDRLNRRVVVAKIEYEASETIQLK
ncbi:MAG: hypothetical protein ACUVWX_10960 [Kiritimatiellia bacterium]